MYNLQIMIKYSAPSNVSSTSDFHRTLSDWGPVIFHSLAGETETFQHTGCVGIFLYVKQVNWKWNRGVCGMFVNSNHDFCCQIILFEYWKNISLFFVLLWLIVICVNRTISGAQCGVFSFMLMWRRHAMSLNMRSGRALWLLTVVYHLHHTDMIDLPQENRY